jgi:hypothetical protein
LIDHLDAACHRVAGREHRKVAAHHVFHFQIVQHTSHAHDAVLTLRAHENKGADDDQPE